MPRLFVLSAVFLVLLLTHSHSLVPRISTLSSHQSLPTFSHHPLHHDQSDSPHHPCCATPFSPPRLRCLIRAASSSLPHPRCLILAVSSSLPYPRCKSSLQLPIFALLTLLTLINRPLQVLLSPSTSGTPSFGAIPSPVYTMSSGRESFLSHVTSRSLVRTSGWFNPGVGEYPADGEEIIGARHAINCVQAAGPAG